MKRRICFILSIFFVCLCAGFGYVLAEDAYEQNSSSAVLDELDSNTSVWEADELDINTSSSKLEDMIRLQTADLEFEPQETGETEPAQAQAKIVTAIEVQGNKSINTNTIVSKMRTRIGNPYRDNIISDDLRRLYLLGFFSDVKIDTEEFKEGLKVIVSVTESPVIEKIYFTGVRRLKLKEDKLRQLLESKETQFLDYSKLTSDTRVLLKKYEEIGFANAQVEYKVDLNQETNKAKVTFLVVENKKTRVRDILISGNLNFSDRRILRLMKTKRAWIFNAGVLKDEVLNEDVDRVKAFYQREGYADAAVAYEVKGPPKIPELLITITVVEGKKYLVGDVSVIGNKEISTPEILAKLKECVPGKVFSQQALGLDIAEIQGLYFNRGYIFMEIAEATSLNQYTGRTDITYKINEKDLAYVNKINIRGNIKTKDLVIRRELRIKPGDKFDGDKLKRSKERLQNLGFFEEVSYDTQESGVPNSKDLVVDVKESKTGSFSFGGGYSTVDSVVGFVEIQQKNFDWKNFPYFTGDGQDLKVRASFGTLSGGYDLSFTEPWMFDYPVSFGFDAYRRNHKRESDVGYGYDEEVTGLDLRLGKEITEYIKSSLMYRYDVIDITNITESATADLQQEYGRNAISSLQFGLTYDDRDSVFDPIRGYLLSGSFESAGGFLGGDKDFLKFIGRFSRYFPLIKRSCIEARLRVGVADAYDDSENLPIYEKFFAGGSYSVRGYDERKVGPQDPVSKDPLGGEAMAVGNIEYTYPLFNFIKLAAFIDTGSVWSRVEDFGDGGFKSAYGLGIRVKTPIGPIMVDYGIPLNKEAGEDEKGSGKFHFSMSHGF